MKKVVKRSFILGSNWLYYKIYTGYKTSDIILVSVIKPIMSELTTKKIIDKWFFIRYSDPHHHIRVRIHFTNQQNIGEIINLLYHPLNHFFNQHLIWKIQTDTYNREIERYGIKSMELAENMFYYDSKMVIDFLSLIEGGEKEDLRWLFSFKVIDSLLSNFNFSIEEKNNLLITLSKNFRSEFDTSKFLGKQLNNKYRLYSSKISKFMDMDDNAKLEYNSILKLIENKYQATKPIINKILKIDENENLHLDLKDLIISLIHMHMNRLFKSKNRMNEMVCYNFLSRYYKSKIAKTISNHNKPQI